MLKTRFNGSQLIITAQKIIEIQLTEPQVLNVYTHFPKYKKSYNFGA